MCFPLLVYKKENIYSSIQINKELFLKYLSLKYTEHIYELAYTISKYTTKKYQIYLSV